MNLEFWSKPVNVNGNFELFFFIGNGVCLTSQVWAVHGKMQKRARQLDFIFNNKEAKSNIWFYFDIYHSDWRFLDGTKRQCK
jgi:hypothetical protein